MIPENLKFDQNGLIPAIVTDWDSGRVLMMAYMNRESLEMTMKEGLTVFWSRSRGELWRKGDTSGCYQHVESITADCDGDTLLIRVRPDGPACHTGEISCFYDGLWQKEDATPAFTMDDLYALLQGRKATLPEGSYTTYLFQKGLDKILKKVGEESTEVIIAGKAQDKAETVYELADLAYHAMVLMVEMGITPTDVRQELARRQIVDHKVKQEKMQ